MDYLVMETCIPAQTLHLSVVLTWASDLIPLNFIVPLVK